MQFSNAVAGYNSQPYLEADSTVTLTASGTTTLSSQQLQTPSLTIVPVSISSSVILAFGASSVGGAQNTSAAYFDVDCANVTLNGHSFTVTNGSGSYNATTLLGTKTLLRVKCQVNTINVG